MIKIQSKPFGEIEIEEKQILDFSAGLFGFENFRRFALIEENAETPFKWLQSLENPELAFIVIQPELFVKDYQPVITKEELAEISLEEIEKGIVFVIVSIPGDDPMKMTANLQGPIIINPSNLTGKQYISKNENHPIRKRILENLVLEQV